MAGFNQQYVGPVEFFKGAMGAVVTRKAKVIRVVEAAAFTNLTMQFPKSAPVSAGAVNPSTLAFPAFFEIWDVAAFQLTSGAIEVIYHT